MNISLVAPNYSVTGQITEADLVTIAAEGFKTIICNRPDAEITPDMHAPFIQAEASRLGLEFIYNPVSNRGFTMANVKAQAQVIDAAKGPILAYCRSGKRSTVCWALVHATRLPIDEIIRAATNAGHNIEALIPQLESMAEDV